MMAAISANSSTYAHQSPAYFMMNGLDWVSSVVEGVSLTSSARSNIPSNPVGFSGAKKR